MTYFTPDTTDATRLRISEVRVRVTSEVIGYNGEMADMVNPRGEITADFGTIEALTEDGAYMILTGFSKNMDDEGAKEALTRLGHKIKCTGTIDLNLWHHDRYMYGTPGWEAEVNGL